jgi:hypothetical protein
MLRYGRSCSKRCGYVVVSQWLRYDGEGALGVVHLRATRLSPALAGGR